MLLLSTGKGRQRKHFKKLKLHAGRQDEKRGGGGEKTGGGKQTLTTVACKAEEQEEKVVVGRGKQIKVQKNIYFNYSGVVHLKSS